MSTPALIESFLKAASEHAAEAVRLNAALHDPVITMQTAQSALEDLRFVVGELRAEVKRAKATAKVLKKAERERNRPQWSSPERKTP